MCRFTLYLGPPVRLATLLIDPSHSLIRQSFESEERAEPLNGDGFGIGWYAPRLTPIPARFHAITPAWNSQNLHSLGRVVTTPCVLAHVRAATAGSGVHLANCHPFAHERYLMMHNGHIGAFRRFRRRLVESLSDEAFDIVMGGTDTEHLFALFVDELERDGGTAAQARDTDRPLALARTLSRAIGRVLALVRSHGGDDASYLNVALSDGSAAVVTRFTDHPEYLPESLYKLEGELYEPAARSFPQRRSDDEGTPIVVSSERLTEDARWRAVPPNSMLVLDRWAPPRTFLLDADGSLLGPVPA